MNIATSLNENYVPYTYTMLYSLLENQTEKVQVFLLENDLSEASKTQFQELLQSHNGEVTFLHVNPDAFDKRALEQGEWPVAAMFRLALFDLLPEDVERILYLDGDMIVQKDLSAFYHMDMQDKHLVVTHDMSATPELADHPSCKFNEHFKNLIRNNRYFNSGMILFDVAYIRENYGLAFYQNRLAELNYDVFAPDQDLLNDVHQNETLYVDSIPYDLFAGVANQLGIPVDTMRRDTYIIHYTGEKPWECGNHFHYPHEIIWWEYAVKTPFSKKFRKDFLTGMTTPQSYYNTLYELEYENRKSLFHLKKLMGKMERLLAGVGEQEMQEEFPEVLDLENYFPPREWSFLPYDTAISLLNEDCPEAETDSFIQNYIMESSMREYVDLTIKTRDEIALAFQQVQSQLAKFQ